MIRMVIRMSEKHIESTKRAVLPNVAAVIDFIRQRRKTTREKAVNLERNKPINPSSEYLRSEDANRSKYNPAMADLKVLYPDGVEPSVTHGVDALVNANFQKDKKVLNELVPTIIPPDSYFEQGELDLLESAEHPLRFPAKVYIRM
jgi:hypothetical protein